MGARKMSTVLWALLVLGLTAVSPARFCEAGLENTPVSLRFEGNASLPECLAAVQAASGIAVSCVGCPATVASSPERFDGSLKDVLRRLAERFDLSSYAMDFADSQRKVVIRVLGVETKGPAGLTADAFPHKGAARAVTPAPDPNALLDTEVTPPAVAGGQAVTLREVASVAEKNLLNQPVGDPLDEIVIPPMAEGESGLTARQVNALREQNRQQQEQIDPLDQEVFPPSAEGEPGLTRRQVESIREKNRREQGQTDPLDQEVLPPGPDGKGGLTLRQRNAIVEKSGLGLDQTASAAQDARPPSMEDDGPGATPR